jgi:hypothetical protein
MSVAFGQELSSAGGVQVPVHRITLGRSQFAVVVAGLVAIFAVLVVAFAFDLNDLYARLAIREYEQQYGFKAGTVRVVDEPAGNFETWGIVAVVAGGPFDRLGVRAGDVPFEYHGHGAMALQSALRGASAGEPSEFDVANAADWMEPRTAAIRTIRLPGAR